MRTARRAVVAVAIGLLTAHSGSAVAQPLPVPWSILDGVRAQLQTPGAAPPGSNDWSCTPSAAHPNPVVLVHGGFVNRTINWQTMSPLLANAGYCVFALTYGSPGWATPTEWTPGAMRPVTENARQIGDFVAEVRRATGAGKVDILAESFGTLSSNHYAKYLGGAASVERIVALSGLWEGTDVMALDRLRESLRGTGIDTPLWNLVAATGCEICPQVLRGSDYLTALSRDGVYAPGVRYTNITSRYDVLLTPYPTSLVPGPETTNIVLQDGCEQDFTEHFSIAASPRTVSFVLGALDPAHAPPVPCELTTPFGR
ncbi:alpha/beta fold hydrolase [Nocardia sp. NPDC050718]|uniref:esterase/lipase family protein n=1 Tax=Nocardia sp. NPDC050718 TaxID=3155788 RepID=UPI0033D38B04